MWMHHVILWYWHAFDSSYWKLQRRWWPRDCQRTTAPARSPWHSLHSNMERSSNIWKNPTSIRTLWWRQKSVLCFLSIRKLKHSCSVYLEVFRNLLFACDGWKIEGLDHGGLIMKLFVFVQIRTKGMIIDLGPFQIQMSDTFQTNQAKDRVGSEASTVSQIQSLKEMGGCEFMVWMIWMVMYHWKVMSILPFLKSPNEGEATATATDCEAESRPKRVLGFHIIGV